LPDPHAPTPGDGKMQYVPGTTPYWLLRGLKSRWQKSTTLPNVTELTGAFEPGSLKHSFNTGIELSRETTKNASYNVSTTTGSACPAVFAGKMDCTPLFNPNPNDPWSGSITRGP